jgi:hypothetical protein
MEYMTKDELLLGRNEKGELLPLDCEVEDVGKIRFIPISRGKFDSITRSSRGGETTKDQDAALIAENLLIPQVTYDELVNSGRHGIISRIIQAMMEESGIVLGQKKTRNGMLNEKGEK